MGQGQPPSDPPSQIFSSSEMRDPGNEVETRLEICYIQLKISRLQANQQRRRTIPDIANPLGHPWRGLPNQETRKSTPSSPFLFDSLPTALGPGK